MTIQNCCTVVRGGWSEIKSFLLEVSSLVLTGIQTSFTVVIFLFKLDELFMSLRSVCPVSDQECRHTIVKVTALCATEHEED